MAQTFKRVGRSLFTTSFTTAALFFANAFSNLLPIQALSIYSGILVLAHFLIIIIMFPPIIIFHEKYLIKNSCCQKKQKNVYAVDSIIRDETCLERFFGAHYNTGVRRLRWFTVIIVLAWTGFVCYYSSDLSYKNEVD